MGLREAPSTPTPLKVGAPSTPTPLDEGRPAADIQHMMNYTGTHAVHAPGRRAEAWRRHGRDRRPRSQRAARRPPGARRPFAAGAEWDGYRAARPVRLGQ